MNDSFGASGDLHAYVTSKGMVRRESGLYEHHGLLGDLSRFSNDAIGAARDEWKTALHALHLDAEGTRIHAELLTQGASHAEAAALVPDKNVKGAYHLGPGLITNVGVTADVNDPAWLAAVAPFKKFLNYHAVGTGTTAAAQTDYQIQAAAAPTNTTAGTGTQSNPSTALTSAQWRTAYTANFASTLAITEWALHNQATLSAATGSPATATSATTLTATGTPFTANALAGFIVVAGSVYGIIASNTTSVLTLLTGWCNTSNGAAGSTPTSTQAFTIQPIMWDHKVFAAINVVSGDSLTTTYTATEAAGG